MWVTCPLHHYVLHLNFDLSFVVYYIIGESTGRVVDVYIGNYITVVVHCILAI